MRLKDKNVVVSGANSGIGHPSTNQGNQRKPEMMLKNKIAVIYGAGGSVGGAVARAFAREGAKLFLTGRNRAPVEAVAEEIVSGGGFAETAEVDALNEQAVDGHLRSVIDKAGRV